MVGDPPTHFLDPYIAKGPDFITLGLASYIFELSPSIVHKSESSYKVKWSKTKLNKFILKKDIL